MPYNNADTDFDFDTKAVHGTTPFDALTGAITMPIYQSATFRHPGLGQSTGFDYSRCVNPTRSELERTIALLEGGKHALAFASGMGAISALCKLYRTGDHLIVSEDLYGGTYRLFNDYYAHFGIEFSWVDTSDFAAVQKAMRPSRTKALFVETPSNPMMKVSDIRALSDLAHANGAHIIVDNTFLTPYFQTPLEHGADIVIHSGTKYLAGHNDTLAGFLVTDDDTFETKLRDAQKSEGATLGAFDSFLVLRGIKTLHLRMERHQENAFKTAEFLRGHKQIEKVFFTGFADHPQYDISKKQARGHSGMISFYLKDENMAAKVLANVKLVLFAESLGGTETLITYPLVQTHAAIPEAMRLSAGVNAKLMRLSMGIENAADLIADLDKALK
ncbi:MAG: PLP-dependent aspartate aminotransferase family protein [Treponemataceae bacterium]|nr:MAG: PLP-dependent aspartate aminotransferase family protein [Treponemataceae bacterium]